MKYAQIGCFLFALMLYVHEALTGGGYIQIIRGKLMVICGMDLLAAYAFAVAIILIAPLVACGGLYSRTPQR